VVPTSVNSKLKEGIQTTMGRQAQRAVLQQLEAIATEEVRCARSDLAAVAWRATRFNV
jgi:hypothetical protein